MHSFSISPRALTGIAQQERYDLCSVSGLERLNGKSVEIERGRTASYARSCHSKWPSQLGRSIMKVRTATLAAGLLAASIPSLSTTAEARPFGFHGGWGHGGGGWGGAGFGLAAGALVGAALAAPYYGGGYGYGYGYPYGYAMADTAMMMTTGMPQPTATAMRRFPTAMATHPTEFTGAT